MRAFRKEKVASAVRQIVAEAIACRLSDPRVAPLTDAIWLNEVRERYRGSALVAFREAVIASFSDRPRRSG